MQYVKSFCVSYEIFEIVGTIKNYIFNGSAHCQKIKLNNDRQKNHIKVNECHMMIMIL